MQPSFNVARFLEESAERIPQNCAIRFPDNQSRGNADSYAELNFSELNRITAATAEFFRSKGIKAGTRTLLMAKPGLDLILCAFALFRIGSVPVAIDPGMGLKNFLSCVKNTSPEALVGIRIAHAIRFLFPSPFKSLKIKITIGTKKFRQNLSKYAQSPNLSTEIFPAQKEQTAAILFTSGSTGAPKGVVYTHGMFDAQCKIVQNFYKISPGEIDLPLLPIFALFNPALGVTTITPEMNPSKPAKLNPRKIVETIQKYKVTNSFGSPILWRKIAEYCEANKLTLPSIKRILCAGTAVHPKQMALFKKILPNAEIHSPYGATENLPLSDITAETVLSETGTLTAAGCGTCTGTIIPDVKIRIIKISDKEIPDFSSPEVLSDLQDFMGFKVGEICVKSPTTTQSYDNNPRATALAKILDTKDNSLWHRMGDLGYLDTQGRLWFLGRKVERVETPTGTLYTESCEAIFNTHPDVFRCALVGLGEQGKSVPAIIIELKKNVSTPQQQILLELKELAKKYTHTKNIQKFFIHPKSFPVDVRHNAKIHRLSLKKIYDK